MALLDFGANIASGVYHGLDENEARRSRNRQAALQLMQVAPEVFADPANLTANLDKFGIPLGDLGGLATIMGDRAKRTLEAQRTEAALRDVNVRAEALNAVDKMVMPLAERSAEPSLFHDEMGRLLPDLEGNPLTSAAASLYSKDKDAFFNSYRKKAEDRQYMEARKAGMGPADIDTIMPDFKTKYPGAYKQLTADRNRQVFKDAMMMAGQESHALMLKTPEQARAYLMTQGAVLDDKAPETDAALAGLSQTASRTLQLGEQQRAVGRMGNSVADYVHGHPALAELAVTANSDPVSRQSLHDILSTRFAGTGLYDGDISKVTREVGDVSLAVAQARARQAGTDPKLGEAALKAIKDAETEQTSIIDKVLEGNKKSWTGPQWTAFKTLAEQYWMNPEQLNRAASLVARHKASDPLKIREAIEADMGGELVPMSSGREAERRRFVEAYKGDFVKQADAIERQVRPEVYKQRYVQGLEAAITRAPQLADMNPLSTETQQGVAQARAVLDDMRAKQAEYRKMGLGDRYDQAVRALDSAITKQNRSLIEKQRQTGPGRGWGGAPRASAPAAPSKPLDIQAYNAALSDLRGWAQSVGGGAAVRNGLDDAIHQAAKKNNINPQTLSEMIAAAGIRFF